MRPTGHRFLRASSAQSVGAKLTRLRASTSSPPGEAAWPYHYELHREEWLIVVEGEVVLRTPAGERALRAGDIVCFPPGAEGAHAVRNDSDARPRASRCRRRGRRAASRSCIPTATRSLIVGPGFQRIAAARRGRRLLGGRAVSEVNLFDVEVTKDDDDPDGYNAATRASAR